MSVHSVIIWISLVGTQNSSQVKPPCPLT